MKKQMHVCILGNLLGRSGNLVTTQGQILGDLLQESGYRITSASSRLNKVLRLGDILQTLLRGGRSSDVINGAEKQAVENGFVKMHLTVSTENTGGIRFYERLSWSKTDVDGNWLGLMTKQIR